MRISVLGAGAWGSALALRLAEHAPVTLWTRSAEHAQRHARESRKPPLSARFRLAARTCGQRRSGFARCEHADLLIAPYRAMRFARWPALREPAYTPLVWLCKGWKPAAKNCRMRCWPKPGRASAAAVLSGPSFAQEVAAGLPAALTVASPDTEFARRVARELHDPQIAALRQQPTVIGVELGGAVKNVIAIAAGISDGLGFGSTRVPR
jgi:glycerol-3-phosphate dehydrogenase (NAD(P)+)